MAKRKSDPKPADPFAALYPNIAVWVQRGYIEMGCDDVNPTFLRALDIGGVIWDGATDYSSIHEALLAMDAGIAAWSEENG